TIDEGEAVTVPAKYIKSFKMSDWWERLYGRSEVGEITIGPSVSDATLDLELVAIGPKRSHIELIRLERVKGGLRKLTFSNESSGAALSSTMILPGTHAEPDSPLECRFSFSFPCK